ncbi:MAG: KEOPS complex kinase/ATPase Bud32 [Candidatus Micrarchaeota archaeon]|nr:KEOPS complex kinase/ATPase Bud32 [Candidatus Micrarchaeota archaeon]
MAGAEAVLRKLSVMGRKAVEKLRVEKKYRVALLDRQIRGSRTKREARLLARAKQAGVLCPVVYEVGEFFIRMKFLEGKMLHHELGKRKITRREIKEAAGILARLHSAGIVHGDYTPANLMLTKEGMAVIDFGLGSISNDCEDKATDVVTMKKALGGMAGSRFVAEYLAASKNRRVVELVAEIERRARYMERG